MINAEACTNKLKSIERSPEARIAILHPCRNMVHASPLIYIKLTLAHKGQTCYDMLRHSLTPASKPKKLCEQSQGFAKHPSAIPAERRRRFHLSLKSRKFKDYKRRRNSGWASKIKLRSTFVPREIH